MEFIKKIIEKSTMKDSVEHLPTVEKLEQFFEHCSHKTSNMFADYTFEGRNGIGSLISWHIAKNDNFATNSLSNSATLRYIKWSGHPQYAYLSIEGTAVCYYYSCDCGSELRDCPSTNDPQHVKMINELFNHYYKKFVLQDVTEQAAVNLVIKD